MKKTIIKLNQLSIGISNQFTIMAGPCAAETKTQTINTAQGALKAGAHIFRANLFKPRTLPQSFQGVGEKGFKWLEKVKQTTKLPVMTEIRTPDQIKQAIKSKIDIIWIGTRNAQNFDLLIAAGKLTKKTKTPVLLKRGMAMRLNEWLGAADYIRCQGNPNVILCERGITTIDPQTTRNLLDLQTAVIAKNQSGLPVVIDPSHAAGRKDILQNMCLASKAAGLDGILIEVHQNPDKALTDAHQQITPEKLGLIIKKLNSLKI